MNTNEQRIIALNRRDLNLLFPSNRIRTSKYNMLNFLPKAMLLQFMRVANIYFLVTAVLQSIPIISPLAPFNAISIPIPPNRSPRLCPCGLTHSRDNGGLRKYTHLISRENTGMMMLLTIKLLSSSITLSSRKFCGKMSELAIWSKFRMRVSFPPICFSSAQVMKMVSAMLKPPI